jgi:hypothetical protein
LGAAAVKGAMWQCRIPEGISSGIGHGAHLWFIRLHHKSRRLFEHSKAERL